MPRGEATEFIGVSGRGRAGDSTGGWYNESRYTVRAVRMLVQELPINCTDRPGRHPSDLQIHPTALRRAIRHLQEPSGNLDIWGRTVFL